MHCLSTVVQDNHGDGQGDGQLPWAQEDCVMGVGFHREPQGAVRGRQRETCGLETGVAKIFHSLGPSQHGKPGDGSPIGVREAGP